MCEQELSEGDDKDKRDGDKGGSSVGGWGGGLASAGCWLHPRPRETGRWTLAWTNFNQKEVSAHSGVASAPGLDPASSPPSSLAEMQASILNGGPGVLKPTLHAL